MLYNYIYINQSTRAQSSLRYVLGIMTIHLVPTNSQVLRLECLPMYVTIFFLFSKGVKPSISALPMYLLFAAATKLAKKN